MIPREEEVVLKGYALSNSFHQPVIEYLCTHPGSYLEIGMYYGHFFTRVCNLFPDRPFYGVDPFISDGCTRDPQGTVMDDIEEIARYNVSQTKNGSIYKGTTKEFLEREDAKEILKTVSCVLIDGSHHYEDIVYDLNLVQTIENDYEKLVLFDDITAPDVERAIQDMAQRLSGRITRTINHPHYVGIYFI